MFEFEEIPSGLFDPVWCKKRRCSIDAPAITIGRIKCNAKNRFNVALSTANPPHNHCTTEFPIYGIADSRLVITVAPQNLI